MAWTTQLYKENLNADLDFKKNLKILLSKGCEFSQQSNREEDLMPQRLCYLSSKID
jgi:hypothetical protein